MQKKSVLFAFIICFFCTLLFPLLTTAEGTLLPPYTGVISPVPPDQWLDPSHGFNQDDLDVLIPLIEKLQLAARDKYGKPVVVNKIDKDTIFVHKLVNEALGEDLQNMDSHQLLRLYRMVGFLQIQPLIDVIAAKLSKDFLPKGIDDKIMQLTTENLAKVRGILMASMENQCGEGSWASISESLKACLQKNTYFTHWKKHENTIADSIGMYGQPRIDSRGAIRYSGITSLHGLGLIDQKDQIYDMDFSENYIMGDIEELGSSFPEKPFSQFSSLKSVNLYRNQIFRLSEDLFQSVPRLRDVTLSGNLINVLPGNLFQSSPEIAILSLGLNPLEVIGVDLFKNLNNLRDISFLDATFGPHAFQKELFEPLADSYRRVWINCMRANFGKIAPGTFNTMPENVYIDLSPFALTEDCSRCGVFPDRKSEGWYIAGGSIGERMFNWVTICRCSEAPYFVALPDPCTIKFLQAAIAMIRAEIPRPNVMVRAEIPRPKL